MSRMTAAQVISLGEYLEPNFDPASLTVSQLLGVLGYHNIGYPTPYSKPKLVHLFEHEIKEKATKLKKERLKKANSIASDDGIIDGATGEPLRKELVARRSSRRLSRIPLQEEEDVVPSSRLEPPKRRRSSAQPVLGGSSRKTAAGQEAVPEESEPEEDELPVRKVGRSKKRTDAAGAQGRRVSNPAAEDSGWEDNNIFQSGAESSSPVRPSPTRPKGGRKSLVSRKSRKSSSAPPQVPLSPSRPPQTTEFHVSPPQSRFDPQLPPLSFPKDSPTRFISMGPFSSPKVARTEHEEDDDKLNLFEPIKEESESYGLEVEASSAYLEGAEDQTATPEDSKVIPRDSHPNSRATLSFFRVLYLILGATACYCIVNFKLESQSIGYCDAGSNTNNALEKLKARRIAVETCNRENRTHLYFPPLSTDLSGSVETAEDDKGGDLTPCPLPPLIPWIHAESCTPCPNHARCSQFGVTCDTGYLLRPHPLLFFLPPSASPRDGTISLSSSPVELLWKIQSEGLDGLPGLGSIALPSRCVEDPKRKKNIGVLGKAMEVWLGQERGRRLCSGKTDRVVPDSEGGDAKKWGIELGELRDMARKRVSPQNLATFDDTFNEAIQQLIQWGGVIIGEDRENYRYLAHKTPDLTWDCAITVKFRELWTEWQPTVFGIILVIFGTLYGRARATRKREERKRVATLVQIALDMIHHQELAHHTDPITAPQPYLSSVQLRDLILQDEHSVSSRSKLWSRVERVVEGNANVRANVEEIGGGDEMRVWRWVGNAHGRTGQLSSRREAQIR